VNRPYLAYSSVGSMYTKILIIISLSKMEEEMKKLLIVALVISMMLIICASATGTTKDFSGQTVTLLMHPTLYKAAGGDTGIIKEFEERTGAKIVVVQAPSPEHTQKAMLDFISKTGAYDVMNIGASELSEEFCENFIPLDEYITLSPDYDFADFLTGVASVGVYKDKQVAIPYRTAQLLTYYRTDLFNEASLSVPTEWDDVYEVAKALTKDTDGDGKVDIYGFAAAGLSPNELAHAWLNPFYGYGGQFILENGRSGFNSEAGIKTAELWTRLYQDGIFPKDIFAWGRDELINAMSQGKLAFGGFTASYYGSFFNDGLSKDQIGFAPLPNNKNRANGWYLAISKYSKNPDLAWELIMELTNKENSLREAVEWSNSSARVSTYNDPSYRALWPQADAMLVATDNGVSEPASKNISLMFEAISEEVTYVMQGTKTSEQGMADLAARVDELLGF